MPHALRFHTSFLYTDRRTKAEYVWRKYQPLLTGKILDVGADERHLKTHLEPGTSYWGIGLGGSPDQEVDLEKERIPFPDGSFDCVLCLDVLEHLDNVHAVFDDLCRVTRKYVIISLPNAWAGFYSMLGSGEYRPGQAIKFYGLPPEPLEDRHKWFFSAQEAEQFVRYRSDKNGMAVLQMDHTPSGTEPGSHWVRWIRILARNILLDRRVDARNLYAGTLWAVLQKNGAS